ncbi:sensor domain-containing protein [Cryptosporangium sp. NPDC051539]|uniref:sensor domain-containing protein n=1 Tax=Cryptosporangium sp. NPDC051539 TaxID=3363962 RepID=UPI0037B5B91D
MSAPTMTEPTVTYEPRRPPAPNVILGAWDAGTRRSAGYLALGFVTGILGLTTFILVVTFGATFSALIVGVPALLACLAVSRGTAEIERRRAALVLGTPLPLPYPLVSGSYLRRIGQWLAAPSTWRDLLHHLLVFPLTLFAAVTALAFWAAGLGAMSLWAWYWTMPNDRIPLFGVDAHPLFVVDSVASAMPWVGVGIALLWVAGWVTKGLARMSVGFTSFLLGPSQSGR